MASKYLQMDKVTLTGWKNKFRNTKQKWKSKGKWTRVNTKNNIERSIIDFVICSRELLYGIKSSAQYNSSNTVNVLQKRPNI